MKKICLLSGLMAFVAVASVNAGQKLTEEQHQKKLEVTKAIDSLVFNGNWHAIFSILDQGVIDVNEYRYMNLTLLGWATSYMGTPFAVKTLLEKYKANPNVVADISTGYSPLMVACKDGDLRVVKLLLEHGANPNFKSQWGTTAIKVAKDYQRFEILRLLEKYTGPAWAA